MKGKTVYFKNLINQIADGDNKSDLGVIEPEIVKEPVRIRIREKKD